MANVFKQFRESKISASILIESATTSTNFKSPNAAEEKVVIIEPIVDMALMVFIVESNTRGTTTSINTVRA